MGGIGAGETWVEIDGTDTHYQDVVDIAQDQCWEGRMDRARKILSANFAKL
jgi:hypothetical protein